MLTQLVFGDCGRSIAYRRSDFMDQMSVCKEVSLGSAKIQLVVRTNIEQDGAVKSLVHDMILENLIVQSPGTTFSSRHNVDVSV